MCEQSVEMQAASVGIGQANPVPLVPKAGGDSFFPPSRGPAASAGPLVPAGSIAVGSLVSFNAQIPSEIHTNDVSRLDGSIFVVDEKLEASNTLVLREISSSETFGCSSAHQRLRRIDFAGESIRFPELVLDLASSVAAGSAFESKPFAACGLLWAVRVSRVSHANPIQAEMCSPPPASSTTSCLPNSISGSRYQKTKGRDNMQMNCTFVTITFMPEYAHLSLEELRASEYALRQFQPTSAPLSCLQAGTGLRYLN